MMDFSQHYCGCDSCQLDYPGDKTRYDAMPPIASDQEFQRELANYYFESDNEKHFIGQRLNTWVRQNYLRLGDILPK